MSFDDAVNELELVSPVMRDLLRRHPEWGEWVKVRVEGGRRALLDREFAEWRGLAGTPADLMTAVRGFKSRECLDIALRDVAGVAPYEETVSRLSELADWVISVTLDAAWKEMAEKSAAPGKERDGFAVIAMGKLGAEELNYSSDVDLVFCRRASEDEQEMRFFTRLGERLVHLLGQPGPEGFLYRVDMRLRPHGGTGPLVPTIDSLENYYESWGEAWERQALIKARPVCGDESLSRRFERFADKFVFARQMDDSSLEEIKQVKHRSEKEYARPGDHFHVKQGPGGIRDIEFYVQYLQLIAGSLHPEVRVRPTLWAIQELGRIKALLEGEEAQLSLAYVFLRTVEHRLQLRMLTPEAWLPDQRADLNLLAGGLGFGSAEQPDLDAFLSTLRGYRSAVRSSLERIYLTPGQLRPREREEEFAHLLSERTPKERVREILGQYGFKDIEKAWQNIRLMALGPAGRLLPPGERRAFLEIVFPMLEVLRASYDPDQALHNLESFAAASGNRVSFLRTLASRRPHLARLANLLALSNLSQQVLIRHPEYFDSLARGINLHEGRTCAEMLEELEDRLKNVPAGGAGLALRRYRQREMIRIAYRDLADLAGAMEISGELSDLAEACLHASLRQIPGQEDSPPWIVTLGKLGSRQMHYSSDLDLMFLYDDPPDGANVQLEQDERVEKLLEFLSGVTAEGVAYKIDLRLRPEGTSGLLARSWSSFLEHARRYMQPWERVALVRSRVLFEAPLERGRPRPQNSLTEKDAGGSIMLPGGGADRGRKDLLGKDAGGTPAHQWGRILEEVVYAFDWNEEAIGAVRHLKRRIEAEVNEESRIYLDFKFGAGGISDLDFMVQLLQARHGGKYPELRVPNIHDALQALRATGILPDEAATDLLRALAFQRRVENHYQLIEEWTSREISRESPLLDRLARSLGYRNEPRKSFLADWERTARQVRSYIDKYFY